MRIAIDGPAGAGKSSVARAVARAFSITYLDTGAMYRALGLKALERGVPTGDEEAVSGLMEDTRITVTGGEGGQRVFLDGRDVTQAIRRNEMSRAASDVSRFPRVRRLMVDMQREIAAAGDVVMDGRDIGTHVMPDADCKFYLTATAEERARRRFRELEARGLPVEYETLLRQIRERDLQDMGREHAPLRPAPDALILDTTQLDEETVIRKVIGMIGEMTDGKQDG